MAIYRRSRAIDPGYAEAEWALALLELLRGNFEAGWSGREVRWRVPDLPIAHFDYIQPMWLGHGSVEGKTVLVHVDEGLGDTIQFVRYVPQLAARGARVVLVVPASLCGLLSGLPGVAQCLPMGGELPAFDMYCPIGSLPLAFETKLDDDPGRCALSACARCGACAGVGSAARIARPLARGSGLVRQSQSQERP